MSPLVSLYGRNDMDFDDSSDGEDTAPTLEGADEHGPPGADPPDVPELVVAEGENAGPDDTQTDMPEFADQSEQATVGHTLGQLHAFEDDLLEDDDTIVASEELSPALTPQPPKPDTVELGASKGAARGLLVTIMSTPLVAYRARKPRLPESGPPDDLVPSMMPSHVIPKPAYHRRD